MTKKAISAAFIFLQILWVETSLAEDWGTVTTPAMGTPKAIGFYTNGCLAGAVAMPLEGPGFSVIRPERNRYFGHPELIQFLKKLAAQSPQKLMIADLSQPRGGPMSYGHGSHQIGLDADIWFKAAATNMSSKERSKPSETSMVRPDGRAVNPKVWGRNQFEMVKRAAQFEEVERIFVNPAIKLALCQQETNGNRRWLAKVRPWFYHDSHFHVRLKCPKGAVECEPQDPPGTDDGCGKEVHSWLNPPPPLTPPTPRPAPRKSMPVGCRMVLQSR